MSYHIQYRDESFDHDWEAMDNSGDNLDSMKVAVDELIETAQIQNLAHNYRLVDDGGSVVYTPDGPEGVRPDGSNSLI